MSLLGIEKNIRIKHQKTNQKRPSPHQSDCQKIAHKKQFLKGISAFISLKAEVSAGMTVEASMVLPLFVFFFVNIGCAVEMIRFQNNMEFALTEVGNQLALYSVPAEQLVDTDSSFLEEVADFSLSYTYVKASLLDYLGKTYVEESPVVGGRGGLWFGESELWGKNDCLDLIVSYRVRPMMEIPGFPGFRMANRYYGHKWNGYAIPSVEEELIYVTEYGEVFHEDVNCTHLFLTIKQVTLWEARNSCNSQGVKYEPCLLCGEELLDAWFRLSVYIAEDGEGIHCRRDCPGLKRTIFVYPKERAKEYPPCSRCVGKAKDG